MLASVLVSFVVLVVVVEPLGVVPFFLTLTRGRSPHEARAIAARASAVGALVLASFAVLGGPVLAALGIGLDAFRVAGGLVLLLAALDMIRRKATCRCSPAEADATREDVAIVPLAIPLLAGPGSMAAVMSLVGREPTLAVLVAIAITFGASYLVLRGAAAVHRVLGDSTLAVIQRVLGLLLAAMSVQAIATGLAALVAGGLA